MTSKLYFAYKKNSEFLMVTAGWYGGRGNYSPVLSFPHSYLLITSGTTHHTPTENLSLRSSTAKT